MCSGHYLKLLGQVNPVIARVCPGLQPPMHVHNLTDRRTDCFHKISLFNRRGSN